MLIHSDPVNETNTNDIPDEAILYQNKIVLSFKLLLSHEQLLTSINSSTFLYTINVYTLTYIIYIETTKLH